MWTKRRIPFLGLPFLLLVLIILILLQKLYFPWSNNYNTWILRGRCCNVRSLSRLVGFYYLFLLPLRPGLGGLGKGFAWRFLHYTR